MCPLHGSHASSPLFLALSLSLLSLSFPHCLPTTSQPRRTVVGREPRAEDRGIMRTLYYELHVRMDPSYTPCLFLLPSQDRATTTTCSLGVQSEEGNLFSPRKLRSGTGKKRERLTGIHSPPSKCQVTYIAGEFATSLGHGVNVAGSSKSAKKKGSRRMDR